MGEGAREPQMVLRWGWEVSEAPGRILKGSKMTEVSSSSFPTPLPFLPLFSIIFYYLFVLNFASRALQAGLNGTLEAILYLF